MGRRSGGRRRGTRLDGETLRAKRSQLGLTQAEVADLAGITARTVQSAESGETVSVSSARTLASVLSVSYATLVHRSAEEIEEALSLAGYAALSPPQPWGAREKERMRVLSAVRAPGGGGACCIAGPPGVGKTALLRHVVSVIRPEIADGIAWVRCSPTSVERTLQVQRDLAEVFGFASHLPPTDRVGAEAFAHSFRQWMWQRPRLLVLDDVGDLRDLEAFVGEHQSASLLVSTTNRAVAQGFEGEVVEIGPLDQTAALGLLADHIGVERLQAEPDAARRLVLALGGVPRGIQIAGSILQRERYTTLADYAARVEHDVRGATAKADTARDDETFHSSYVQIGEKLSVECWRFFAHLAPFADLSFPLSWAESISELSPADVRRHLGELVDYYLVREIQYPLGERPLHFALDAQSAGAARRVAADEGFDTTAALIGCGWRQARRVGEATLEEGAAELAADFDLWRLCLDTAAGAVLPPLPSAAPPRDLTAGTDVGAAHHLPDILIELSTPMRFRMPPDLGRWLTAGLAVARARRDRQMVGRLSRLMGAWQVLHGSDVSVGVSWCLVAAEALLEEDCAEEGLESLAFAAILTLFSEGAEACLPRFEHVVELSREGAVTPTAAACHENSLGLVLGVLGDLERSEDTLSHALDVDLDGDGGEVLRSICLLNLAQVQRLRARPFDATGAAAALELLGGIVEDDELDLLRLAGIGQRLGIERQGWSVPPYDDDTRRYVLLSTPPELLSRRLMRLRELAIELGAGTRQPTGGGMPPAEALGTTGILLGLPMELELGFPGLLYPLAPVVDLLDGVGLASALDFVQQTCGPGHPVHAALSELGAGTSGGRQLSPFFRARFGDEREAHD